MARPYRCLDCPPGHADHQAGARGPLPDRCPAHREAKDKRRDRRKRSTLSLVPDGAHPGPSQAAPAAPETPAAPVAQPVTVPSVLGALERDLDGLTTRHPAAETLSSVAKVLALVLDSPVAQMDGRVMAAVSKELRSTVGVLTDFEEADHDDLFSGGSAPVVVPSAG